jgi:tetratricopeptide (TPR) repeat protein
LSDFIGASTDLETSIKLDSTNHKAYLYYGRIYFAQGFFNTAIQYYNIAISMNPNDAEVYDNRAIAKGKQGDYKGAIIDESIAIKMNPSKVDYYNNRGFAKLELKQYEEAIKDFNLVLKNGNNPQAYANRGIAFAGLGRHNEAIEDFTKGIEKMPKAKDIHYLRGLSYKAIGKEKEACSDFATSTEMGYEPARLVQKKYCLNK